MTTTGPEQFIENMLKMNLQFWQISNSFLHKQMESPPLQLDPFAVTGAFVEVYGKIFADHELLAEASKEYFENLLQLGKNISERFMGANIPAIYEAQSKDIRFKDESWHTNVLFDLLKQTYLMSSHWILSLVHKTKDVDRKTLNKVAFFTKQYVDALSPSNFALTNPAVIKATIESNGANLVRGMHNLLHDIKKSQTMLNISTADTKAYKIGRDIAATEGVVIYKNKLMELIYYKPHKDFNYERPLLVIPPWINKYYILDLKKENSFIGWMLDKGYPVFLISWVNPDSSYAEMNFDDYMELGLLAAMDAVERITNFKEFSAVGYCIGGTLLACTLSYMKKHKDDRIKNATFFTTLIDFNAAGDLATLIDDDQIALMEKKAEDQGVFSGFDMASTFSLLRANEMIWSFMINNYLLGKAPFPFDLLYWNADSTNLPKAMYSFYMRNMYEKNALIKANHLRFKDTPISIQDIDIPCFFISCKDDHIAPWKSTYNINKILKKNITFILSASGHIAGIINPPKNEKYCFWTNSDLTQNAEHWLENAEERKGSWWDYWHHWNASFAPKLVPAYTLEQLKEKPLGAAPGQYVKTKC